MDTLGWLFILAAALIARSVYKGRVLSIGQDLSDAFLALINRDGGALGAALSRTGDAATPTIDTSSIGEVGAAAGDIVAAANGAILVTEVLKLGKAAKGYRWTATGPDYYDCSGLMWRGCKNTGLFTGVRFTTYTLGTAATGKAFQRVTSPQIGDIVCWPTHHMGVVTGPDQFYSAKSTKLGIGYAKISTWMKSRPYYYRPTQDMSVSHAN